MVRVQVLIPCYNYGKYLEQCVSSALDQENVDVGVLIIDDCSPDDTPEICKALAAKDARVRFIRHQANRGHIATYNEGIEQINGDYFVLLSADDCLAPGSLGRATSLMESNPNVGMVYGQAISFDTERLPQPRTIPTGFSIWAGEQWIREVCRSGRNFIVCPEVVVRSSVQRQLGGYDPTLPHSGDMEMWLRIAAVADIGRVNGVDQAFYRVHPQSMQRTVHSGFLFDLVGRREAYRSAFAKEGAKLAARDELHLLAKQALAFTAIRHARKLCFFPSDDTVPSCDYRNFAVSLFPEVVRTRSYLTLLAAEREDRNILVKSVARLIARCRKLVEEEVFSRVEYRWFRRTGAYFPRCSLKGFLAKPQLR